MRGGQKPRVVCYVSTRIGVEILGSHRPVRLYDRRTSIFIRLEVENTKTEQKHPWRSHSVPVDFAIMFTGMRWNKNNRIRHSPSSTWGFVLIVGDFESCAPVSIRVWIDQTQRTSWGWKLKITRMRFVMGFKVFLGIPLKWFWTVLNYLGSRNTFQSRIFEISIIEVDRMEKMREIKRKKTWWDSFRYIG